MTTLADARAVFAKGIISPTEAWAALDLPEFLAPPKRGSFASRRVATRRLKRRRR